MRHPQLLWAVVPVPQHPLSKDFFFPVSKENVLTIAEREVRIQYLPAIK